MNEQTNAAWAINDCIQKEYYKMYGARNELFKLLCALEYTCRGLEDPQRMCRNAIEACGALSEPIGKLDQILAPFDSYGFRDKYEDLT